MSEGTELWVRCCSCKAIFSDLNELYRHVREDCELKDGPEKSLLVCSFCDKGFRRKYDHDEHVRSHTGERPFNCPICAKGFTQAANYRRHIKTHKVWPYPLDKIPTLPLNEDVSVVLDNGYQCQFCETLFTKHSLFKAHLRSHSALKVYKCLDESCECSFNSAEDYLAHYSSMHGRTATTGPAYKCSICKAPFRTLKGLQNHSQTAVHEVECHVCSAVLSSDATLRRHLKSHQLVEKKASTTKSSHTCDVCGNTFKTLFYLKAHRRIHTGELPFKCSSCPAKFNRRDKLKRHELIHRSECLTCPFFNKCRKSFKRMDKLKDHLIISHGDVDGLTCRECMGPFANLHSLKRHLLKDHGPDGRLKCPACSDSFKQASSYQEHMREAHEGGGPAANVPLGIDFLSAGGVPLKEVQEDEMVLYVPLNEESGEVMTIKEVNSALLNTEKEGDTPESPVDDPGLPQELKSDEPLFNYEDNLLSLLEGSLETELFS